MVTEAFKTAERITAAAIPAADKPQKPRLQPAGGKQDVSFT